MNNKILKKILGLFGYKAIDKELIKKDRLLSKKSFLTIDKLLENLFSRNKVKSLIQIGANDGQRFDTINYFIKTYSPSCLLVEPIKENFEKLKKNYNKFSKVTFDNSAITVGDEINYLYKVGQKFLIDYDDHIPGITSFDKNHLIKHGVKKTHIIKERVETITINNLILKHKLLNFDLLFVDVEGYDANIVIDFFSNSSLRPIIVLEYIHIKNDIFKNLINILELNKYIFFSINENMICFPEEDKNLISFN